MQRTKERMKMNRKWSYVNNSNERILSYLFRILVNEKERYTLNFANEWMKWNMGECLFLYFAYTGFVRILYRRSTITYWLEKKDECVLLVSFCVLNQQQQCCWFWWRCFWILFSLCRNVNVQFEFKSENNFGGLLKFVDYEKFRSPLIIVIYGHKHEVITNLL